MKESTPGPIILQEAVTLPYTRDDKEVAEASCTDTEHELLPRAIRLIATGRGQRRRADPRLVRVDEGALDDDG